MCNRTKRFFLFLLLFLGCLSIGFAQTVEIKKDRNGQSLKNVLEEIRKQTNVEISYDNDFVAQKRLLVYGVFSTPEAYFEKAFTNTDLRFKKLGKVYIIFQAKPVYPKEIALRFVQESHAPVHNAHVIVNRKSYVSNDSGIVRITIHKPNLHVQAQHIAFQGIDSVLTLGKQTKLNFRLKNKKVRLQDVIVLRPRIELAKVFAYATGKVSVGHSETRRLAGAYSGHAWNMLKSMPGIFSSHEVPVAYLIKGDMPGQTAIDYDDIRLYELEHFLGNLSGAQGAVVDGISFESLADRCDRGDFSGGLLTVTTKDFHDSLYLEVGRNGIMMDGVIGTPLWEGANLLIGGRNSTGNTYNTGFMHEKRDSIIDGVSMRDSVITPLQPYYKFSDISMKLIQTLGNGSLKVAFYKAHDEQDIHTNEDGSDDTSELKNYETGTNQGVSLRLNYPLAHNVDMTALFSHSSLDKARLMEIHKSSSLGTDIDKENVNSSINEVFTQAKLTYSPWKFLEMKAGWEHSNVALNYKYDRGLYAKKNYNEVGEKSALFYSTEFCLQESTVLKLGNRSSLVKNEKNWVHEPRVKFSQRINDKFSFFTRFARQTQFFHPAIERNDGNESQYYWVFNKRDSLPISYSWKANMGLSFNHKRWSAFLQSSYRFVNNSIEKENNTEQEIVFQIKNYRYRSLEAFVNYHSSNYSVWASYVLSKSDKREKDESEDYLPTIIDQRHEVKITQDFSWQRFNVSSSWIYGSGMPFYLEDTISGRTSEYFRLDLSCYYFWKYKGIELEIGGSVLNLLNRINPKYSTPLYSPTVDTKGYSFSYEIRSVPRMYSFDVRLRWGKKIRNQKKFQ